MTKNPNEVLSPLKKIITSVRIKKIIQIIFKFLIPFSFINIPKAKINGNSLDKKLPTIISSPKKLDNLLNCGDVMPNILWPKKYWK